MEKTIFVFLPTPWIHFGLKQYQWMQLPWGEKMEKLRILAEKEPNKTVPVDVESENFDKLFDAWLKDQAELTYIKKNYG